MIGNRDGEHRPARQIGRPGIGRQTPVGRQACGCDLGQATGADYVPGLRHRSGGDRAAGGEMLIGQAGELVGLAGTAGGEKAVAFQQGKQPGGKLGAKTLGGGRSGGAAAKTSQRPG